MKLYTYFIAMEKAHAKYRIFGSEKLGWQYARIRDGLIKRFERVELKVLTSDARADFWLEECCLLDAELEEIKKKL